MSRFPKGTNFTVDISPNKTVANNAPTSITLHWWDDPAKKPAFGGVVSWFKNRSAQVSAHYVVEANRICQMVLEKDTAWHSGSTQGNQRSVGIEVNPRLSDGDYEATAILVAEIWDRRGKELPVYPHRHWFSTSCPGTLDVDRVVRRARQLSKVAGGGGSSSGGGSKSKPASSTSNRPSGPGLAVDGICGPLTVNALQRALGVTVDGLAGPQTWTALQRKLNAPFVDGVISRQYWSAAQVGRGIVARSWEHVGPGAAGSQTVQLLQRKVGAGSDGVWYQATTRALQSSLNRGDF